MECNFRTEFGTLCGLGCSEGKSHCWRHMDKIEAAEHCYDLIVARGMPKTRLGDDVGMPDSKVKTQIMGTDDDSGNVLDQPPDFSPGEE